MTEEDRKTIVYWKKEDCERLLAVMEGMNRNLSLLWFLFLASILANAHLLWLHYGGDH
jgi:hypothetical protein